MLRHIILAATLCGAIYAHAGSYLDSLAAKVLQTNPEINSLDLALKAAILDAEADNQLPAPEIEVEHLFAGKGEKDKTGVSISQSFDWPGSYRARSKAIEASRHSSSMQLNEGYRNKLLDTKMLMLDIIYTRRELSLLDSVAANIEHMLDFTTTAFRQGENTILDVNRLRIERLSLRSRRSAAEIRSAGLRTSLEALAGGADVSDVWRQLTVFPEYQDPSEEAMLEATESKSPAVAAAIARLETAKAVASAKRSGSYPGFSLGYKYAREEGHNFHGFTAGISLPFVKKNKAAAAAQLEATAAEFDLAAARAQTRADLMTSVATVEQYEADNAEYKKVYGDIDYMRLLTMAYKGGEINSVEYLTSINYFIEGYLAYLESEYNRTVASLRLDALL